MDLSADHILEEGCELGLMDQGASLSSLPGHMVVFQPLMHQRNWDLSRISTVLSFSDVAGCK